MLVLIVDDDANVREALKRIIDSMGHATCWAETGSSGLRLMRSEHPDLVILDVKLPGGLDGFGVLREKLLDANIRSIPVAVISGMTPDEIRTSGEILDRAVSGAILILGKPIDIPVLQSLIRSLDSTDT